MRQGSGVRFAVRFLPDGGVVCLHLLLSIIERHK